MHSAILRSPLHIQCIAGLWDLELPKDWELPNSQIRLAEIDIESSLDFPI